MAGCAPFDTTGPYVSSVLSYADCQGLSLGEAGYRALGAGSPFGMALTGLLTILVALIGYRLLLGGEFSIREAVTTALKLGIVLALATQWSAYRTVLFDVAASQPEQAAAGFLAPEGLGSQGSAGLAARIDGVDGALAEILDQSSAARASIPPQEAAALPRPQVAMPGKMLPERAEKSLDTAIDLLVATALTGFLAVRMTMALLLAIGPVFIACLLFDTTRSLFAGWLRSLIGTGLGALAVPVVLALQLSIIEPQVLQLRALIDANQQVSALPQQILGTAAAFALTLLAVLAILVRTAAAVTWPERIQRSLGDVFQPALPSHASQSSWRAVAPPPEDRSRAQLVAEAAQAIDLRGERMREAGQPGLRLALPHGELPAALGTASVLMTTPLGQQGRRSYRRPSPGAHRRDELQ